MNLAITCISLLVGTTIIVGSCARAPQETGFLSTYKNLHPVSATYLRYIAPEKDLAKYTKFIIDPITVKFYAPSSTTSVPPEDVQHLTDFLFQEINQTLSTNYEIVSTPGPDVAQLRIAITDLKSSTPALNVLPQTKLMGIGLGELSIEAEVVDSTTGTQLAAIVESEKGSRLSFSGLSKWGDVEAIMREWAARLKTRIDEIRDKKAL